MNRQDEALIFDIQKYSIHDGPGIRTLIFFKGCPLRCQWCCNPESQRALPELMFKSNLCIKCGRCAEVCPRNAIDIASELNRINRDECANCGICVSACNMDALSLVGKWMTIDQVFSVILRDKKYYLKSGGGVTLSGGEPLFWDDFCLRLLKKCYENNIHTAVETSGYVNDMTLARIAQYVDIFLYDIKSMDKERHKHITGVSNSIIIDNLKKIRAMGKNVILRIPLIPEKNYLEDELENMFKFASDIGITEINIMPYHNLGESKYKGLGRKYDMEGIEPLKFSKDFDIQMQTYSSLFKKYKDIDIRIGG